MNPITKIDALSLRFGMALPEGDPASQSAAYAGANELRAWLKEADKRMDDMVFKPVNQAPPETTLSKAKAALKRVLLPLAGLSALLITSAASNRAHTQSITGNPFSAYGHSQDARPRIYPNWQRLSEVTQTAQATGKTQDPQMIGQFVDRYHGFLYQVMGVLRDHPGMLDQALQDKLARTPDFRPNSNLRSYANDFIDFMKREINRLGVAYDPDRPTSPIPGPDVINQVDIKGKFLDNLPELGVPQDRRQEFADALREAFKRSVRSPKSSDFMDIFVASVGTGVDGVTLDEFAGAHTREDAQRLLDKTLNNSNNFKNWTPAERDALKKRVNQILGGVNSQSHDVLLMLLTSLAGLGAVGVAALYNKRFIGAVQALAVGVPKGLRESVLVINTADMNNPQVRQYLGNAFGLLKDEAQSAADLFAASFENSSDFQEQWRALGKSQKDLPTADDILQQVLYDVKEASKNDRTFLQRWKEEPLSELAFVQALVNAFEEGKESGALFVKLGMPQGTVTPTETDVAKAKDPVDALRIRRQVVQHKLRDARKLFLQHTLMALQVDAEIAKHQQAISDIARQARIANVLTDEAKKKQQRSQLGAQLLEREAALKAANARKKTTDELLLRTKLTIRDAVADYSRHLEQLNEWIQRGEHVAQREQLLALRDKSKQELDDPRLNEITEDILDQEAMQAAIAQREAKEKGQLVEIKTLLHLPAQGASDAAGAS